MSRRSIWLSLVVILLVTLLALPAMGKPLAYRIEKGDTLAKVAEKTGISLADLLAWNEWVEDPQAVLKVGKLVVLRNPYGRAQFEESPRIQGVSELLVDFYNARLAKDQNAVAKYATDEVLKKYTTGSGGLTLFGTSTPSFSRFSVLGVEARNGSFVANARIHERAWGKEVGYFDEQLIVSEVNGALKITNASRSEYTSVYVVAKGDNLWIIAQKLGMKTNKETADFVAKLKKLNDLSDKDILRENQVLILP